MLIKLLFEVTGCLAFSSFLIKNGDDAVSFAVNDDTDAGNLSNRLRKSES